MSVSTKNAFAALRLDDDEASESVESTPAKEGAAKWGFGDASWADGDGNAVRSDPTDTSPLIPDMRLKEPLVWIDCEMTGLVRLHACSAPVTDLSPDWCPLWPGQEVDECTILEIAVVLTDGQLNNVIHGPEVVIHHSDEVLAGMNDWCRQHHEKSGLTDRVRQSTVSMEEAESQVLRFVRKHTQPGCCHLAGNTVHCDLGFIKRYMPRLAAHLHYRIVDVSSVRELARRWFPDLMKKAPRKEMRHTARSDILESLNELIWLRKTVFKASNSKG